MFDSLCVCLYVPYRILVNKMKLSSPFTRWSKHEAKTKQTYSKYTCTTCAL